MLPLVSAPKEGRRAARILLLGLAAFIALLGYLVASSLQRRAAPVFLPSPTGQALGTAAGPDTVTVDARDEVAWRYVDLDSRVVLEAGDSAGWDLAVRRFRIRAARGAADLGRWYSYSALSHLLQSKGVVYLVTTDEERIAEVDILSYYCPGLEAGCLTWRYQLRPPAPGAPQDDGRSAATGPPGRD